MFLIYDFLTYIFLYLTYNRFFAGTCLYNFSLLSIILIVYQRSNYFLLYFLNDYRLDWIYVHVTGLVIRFNFCWKIISRQIENGSSKEKLSDVPEVKSTVSGCGSNWNFIYFSHWLRLKYIHTLLYSSEFDYKRFNRVVFNSRFSLILYLNSLIIKLKKCL